MQYIREFPNEDYGDVPTGMDLEACQNWVYSLKHEFRLYQFTITQTCFYYNTLVCLPTGLGKTYIGAMLIKNFVKWFPQGKIFFLAPTRPLVNQQQAAMEQFGIKSFLTSKDRQYKENVYFSTPHIIDNDIKNSILQLDDIKLVIFDEAHRTVGDYSYSLLAQKLQDSTRLIGLSATPGNNIEQIQKVITNLKIAKLELRDENDPQVSPYLKLKCIEKIVVKFDDNQHMKDLNADIKKLLNVVVGQGILPVEYIRMCHPINFSFGACYRIRQYFQDQNTFRNLPINQKRNLNDCMHQLQHLAFAKKILLEQGLKPYLKYTNQEQQEETHPKVLKLREILYQHFQKFDSKVIIFTNSRDNAQQLCNTINDVEGVKASIFIGQATSKTQVGMKQKQQIQVVEQFKNELNVLVATCIAEEGLDIGEVDLIICFDSGFSPIRMIQRMGRTGRKKDGKVIILLTEGKEENDFDKSKYKFSKLIKELKKSELNYFSRNSRILQSKPQLIVEDDEINKIDYPQEMEVETKKLKNQNKQRVQNKQKQKVNTLDKYLVQQQNINDTKEKEYDFIDNKMRQLTLEDEQDNQNMINDGDIERLISDIYLQDDQQESYQNSCLGPSYENSKNPTQLEDSFELDFDLLQKGLDEMNLNIAIDQSAKYYNYADGKREVVLDSNDPPFQKLLPNSAEIIKSQY